MTYEEAMKEDDVIDPVRGLTHWQIALEQDASADLLDCLLHRWYYADRLRKVAHLLDLAVGGLAPKAVKSMYHAERTRKPGSGRHAVS